MDRREALASLASLAGATGMAVTPVTAKDAEQCVLIILKLKGRRSDESMRRLRDAWERATEFTPLGSVRTVVMDDDIDVEFVRR